MSPCAAVLPKVPSANRHHNPARHRWQPRLAEQTATAGFAAAEVQIDDQLEIYLQTHVQAVPAVFVTRWWWWWWWWWRWCQCRGRSDAQVESGDQRVTTSLTKSQPTNTINQDQRQRCNETTTHRERVERKHRHVAPQLVHNVCDGKVVVEFNVPSSA